MKGERVLTTDEPAYGGQAQMNTDKQPEIKVVLQVLGDFLTGKGSPWAWDDFTEGMRLTDTYLEQIRRRCAGLSREFPPDKSGEYCNSEGRTVIRNYIEELRRAPLPNGSMDKRVSTDEQR